MRSSSGLAWGFFVVLGLVLAGCGQSTSNTGSGNTQDSAQSPGPSAPASEPAPEPDTKEPQATIRRDEWGVPHVFADTLPNAAYGLGYAQAEDRLEDIFLNIRTALGSLSEIQGAAHVDTDYIMRLLKNEQVSRDAWASAPDDLKAIGDAFMRGVKTYMDEHPDKVPAFAVEPEGWQCMAIGRAMVLRWPVGTVFDDLKNKKENPGFGSNGWAVAPARTEDGCAILLADPHLTWEGLAVFYEARIHAGGHDLSGFFLTGTPLPAIGHSAHVAWACTTGGPDTSDVYLMKLNPDNPMQYEYDGEWREASVTSIKIPVKDADPVERMAAYTHLGPVVGEPDMKNGVAYVGASPYFESSNMLEQIYRMCLAEDAEAFRQALGMNQLMEQNIIFADRQGNIGYIRSGATPIRPDGFDWSAPVPGNTSETAWKGIHTVDDLVQIMNPEQGYLQNCNISPANIMKNSPLLPDKYPPYIYNVSWDDQNPRSLRLLDLLDSDAKITRQKAMDIALDVYDINANAWRNALRLASDNESSDRVKDPAFLGSIRRVIAWDGLYIPESMGAPLMKFLRLQCKDENVLCEKINSGQELSKKEQKKLLDCFEKALTELKTQFNRTEIAWGEIQLVGRGDKLFPTGGADYGRGPIFTETLFDVKGNEMPDKRILANSGSMATQLVFLHPDKVESFTVTPWGQSADPASPHYADQSEKLYSPRKMKPAWFNPEDLEGHISSELTLTVH